MPMALRTGLEGCRSPLFRFLADRLDNAARLVVVELKRTDDGGHLELQALRYAAMGFHDEPGAAFRVLRRHPRRRIGGGAGSDCGTC